MGRVGQEQRTTTGYTPSSSPASTRRRSLRPAQRRAGDLHSGFDSTRPDIVFSHNIPYVSWHEAAGSTTLTFVGHFEGNPANPTFHIDSPAAGIPTTSVATSDDDVTDVRTAIASTCPADPFTGDGATCQGGSIGTPFFAFTNGSPRALFAQGYRPRESIQTGTGTGTRTGQATLSGSVNPAGAPVNVRFDFGPTTRYGSSTPPQFLLGSPTLESQTGFSARVGGLRPGRPLPRGRDQRLRDVRRA